MKKYFTFPLLFFVLFANAQTENSIWYKKPAEQFESALPIGNGRMGAMIYGGVSKERISLNEATLWSGAPVPSNQNPQAPDYLPLIRKALFNGEYKKADSLTRFMQGKFSNAYEPLGNLWITSNISNHTNYKRMLDLHTGVVHVDFDDGDTHYSREYFISYPDQLLYIRMKAIGSKKQNVSVEMNSLLLFKLKTKNNNELHMYGHAPSVSEPSYRGNMQNAVKYDTTKAMRFAGIAKVLFADGSIHCTDTSLNVTNASEIILAVSMATSFNGFDKNPSTNGKDEKALASKPFSSLSSFNYKDAKARHTTDFSKFFDRVKLKFDNANLDSIPTDQRLKNFASSPFDNGLVALYFQYGRYLMISSSRTPNVPINLQGIWNEQVRPPWSSNYTININTQMNYWPVETTNLSEFHTPLFGFIRNLSKTGTTTARSFYGLDGWVAHHNTDIWAMSNAVGDFGKGDPVWANWDMGGTWLSTHLWQHFLFSNDLAFLRNEAYPIMKGAARFCMNLLVEHKNEFLTAPSTSPENRFVNEMGFRGAVLFGGTADLAMIRELLNNTLAAEGILNSDKKYADSIRYILAKLHPYQIGKKGNLQEWYYDWDDDDPNHRHVSHLFSAYPGTSITMNKTPELADAVKKSLELRTNNGTGWSIAWKINLWARLRNGERAFDAIKTILAYYPADKNEVHMSGGGTYPNLLDAHPPFQIDGNFGATSGIAEMLMQSHDGEILLLPALPEQWSAGMVSGLKARGNFTVDIQWESGKLISALIKPAGKNVVSVRYGGKVWKTIPGKSLNIKFNN